MIKLYLTYLFLCIYLCLFGNNLLAQSNYNDFSEAERIINKYIRKNKVPGLAITVSKDGNIVWSKGFGFADISNEIMVNPDSTIFRIGSVSKPIAALALLKIVEDGLIALDSSVYHYVSYFPEKKYDITIKQLGTHLSGIRNYKDNEFKINKPLSIREGISLFEHDTLLFKPGSNFAYTSFNWNLISLAIQEQSQVPFEDFVQSRVLWPFKMTRTFPDKNQDLEGKAVFYKKVGRRQFKPESNVNNYYKLASGAYLSTASDLNKFGNALLNDSLVNHNQLKPFITIQYINNDLSKSTFYGIGFQVSYDADGRAYFGHIGNGLGSYSILYVYPEYNVVLAILINSSYPKGEKIFNKLINYVFESF